MYKNSTVIKQTNFSFQISFYAINDKEGQNAADVKDFFMNLLMMLS